MEASGRHLWLALREPKKNMSFIVTNGIYFNNCIDEYCTLPLFKMTSLSSLFTLLAPARRGPNSKSHRSESPLSPSRKSFSIPADSKNSAGVFDCSSIDCPRRRSGVESWHCNERNERKSLRHRNTMGPKSFERQIAV